MPGPGEVPAGLEFAAADPAAYAAWLASPTGRRSARWVLSGMIAHGVGAVSGSLVFRMSFEGFEKQRSMDFWYTYESMIQDSGYTHAQILQEMRGTYTHTARVPGL